MSNVREILTIIILKSKVIIKLIGIAFCSGLWQNFTTKTRDIMIYASRKVKVDTTPL
jgi:hypothetical protein